MENTTSVNEMQKGKTVFAINPSVNIGRTMIKITDLEKIYRTENIETVALNKLSMEVKEGEFVAVMGPSGCGKSTLLNVLGLLDDANSGSFLFNGIEVAKFNESKRADLRKRNIGFVFQSFNLIDELTVYENVELPLIYTGIKSSERKKKVEFVLDKMQIMHRRGHYPQQLSGGQQQRVAVARAVVNNPKLILADEPTGNLDSNNGNEVMELLTQLNEQGATIVMVTHSEHDARYSHRIIRMLDGQTVIEIY
jgi:putative ABC transport system ATP-binding protein